MSRTRLDERYRELRTNDPDFWIQREKPLLSSISEAEKDREDGVKYHTKINPVFINSYEAGDTAEQEIIRAIRMGDLPVFFKDGDRIPPALFFKMDLRIHDTLTAGTILYVYEPPVPEDAPEIWVKDEDWRRWYHALEAAKAPTAKANRDAERWIVQYVNEHKDKSRPVGEAGIRITVKQVHQLMKRVCGCSERYARTLWAIHAPDHWTGAGRPKK